MSISKSRVLHRSLRESPPKAIGGEGVWLIGEDGRRILDASGGAAVSCLGHQHPRVIEAISRQASKLAYAHTGFFSSEPAEALAEKLVGHEPGGLGYAYLVSGGSEAIEAAIKLARQYFIEIGQPQRRHFIARRQRVEVHFGEPIWPAQDENRHAVMARVRTFLEDEASGGVAPAPERRSARAPAPVV